MELYELHFPLPLDLSRNDLPPPPLRFYWRRTETKGNELRIKYRDASGAIKQTYVLGMSLKSWHQLYDAHASDQERLEAFAKNIYAKVLEKEIPLSVMAPG